MSSSVVALAPIFALVTLVNSAVADPSELAKPPADITKHASEMIKRIEKDLCAMQSDHRPEPTKTLVGPLCTDLKQMNKQTLADMELIQRHLDKTLTAHSSRQRDIDMFTFYRDHYPFDTSDPDPAAIQIQLESIRLAILFSKSSKVIETITSKTPENESLKAPSVQFILRSLTESLVQIKKLQPDQAKSPYKYNTEEIEILKKASQTKQNSPKLSSTELSILQSIIASFPVQKEHCLI
ncbi:MAG: hypothetical protein IPJ84_09620 [Bdellovibrionales bacterium]|nr:hypothetical protein [Bdellovibrionales bacterium]